MPTLVPLILLIAIAIAMIGVLFILTTPKHRHPKPSRANASPIRHQLYRMVQDDAAVERLLALTRKNYPGQSEQWILEKTLAQLERDRRY